VEVRVLVWNMGHFYSNSQMARDLWLDYGLCYVSVTVVVKRNKKAHCLFPSTVTMIIRWHINSLDICLFLLAALTCFQQQNV